MPFSRREFLLSAAALSAAPALLAQARASRPRPSRPQLAWQQDEVALFCHFGVNTFTNREWGDGTESPSIFNPSALDCRQWTRAAKAAGAKALILTAKHHDGFCLWPTATTSHSVKSSPFRGGNGDLVREFIDACHADGLRPGLYLSPWDRNHSSYGDSPRYNEVYRAQLTELLTRYGAIHEVWFDGANGEGPNGKRQVYDWPATWALVRKLQPNAVMFSDAGPDLRWIGNERGVAGETNWSMVKPEIVPVPGLEGAEVMRSLQEGDRDGTVWRPGETDVSIRPGWFWHPAEDAKVRTPDNLEQLWFTSVGRNSKLLLNVPPTTSGLFHENDVQHLTAMRSRITECFANDIAKGAARQWQASGANQATLTVTLPRAVTISAVDLREDIANGQRVAGFTLEGRTSTGWQTLMAGTTIGHRRASRIDAITLSALRLRITDAIEPPRQVALAAFSAA
ncbi:MAG: alpha-L-fucosidase [Gemmatimonadaceae bacterium]|nr:alpha-L-fucosidase [Gemmatimonadaceae bacterium]